MVFGAADSAHARLTFRFDSKLEIDRGSDGGLRPVSVTCDPFRGELVVTDARQMGIHIFNPDGLQVFRTNRFADLVGPLDASVDAEGRTVYLRRIAGVGHELRRLNLYGEPDLYRGDVPDRSFSPTHLIVTRDGNYLSLDGDVGVVVKNDSETGALIWSIRLGDTSEAEDGLLNLGRPAESPDGLIAIPGGELHSTLIFSADGELVKSFGRMGTSPGRVVFPVAAVFGPEGTLLVLDRMRHKVLVYGPDYNFQTEFGSMGAGPGQFYHPVAMAGADDGRLFVAQGFEGRVQVFNILSDGDR